MKDLRRPAFCRAAKPGDRAISDRGKSADRSAPVMAGLQSWLRHYLAAQPWLQLF
jgi:hypothetical protein